VGWEAGGRDGWSADPRPVIRRVLASARPGSILVLHEGRAHSLTTILAVVDALLERGYRFVIPDPAQFGAGLADVPDLAAPTPVA
jgi:hypothetical protein